MLDRERPKMLLRLRAEAPSASFTPKGLKELKSGYDDWIPKDPIKWNAPCDASILRRPKAVQDLGFPEGLPSVIQICIWQIPQK